MINFAWERHRDLDPDGIDNRQRSIVRGIALAGIEGVVCTYEPTLRLPPNFCQKYAASYRIMVEQQCLSLLRSRSTDKTFLLAVHIVPPHKSRHTPMRALSPKAVNGLFERIRKRVSKQPAIKAFIGCYEVDHSVGLAPKRWQGTVHALVVVKARTLAAAKACVVDCLSLRSSPSVYRPVVCREVADPPGAVRYAFKSLQFGSVTSRLTWTAKGRKWARTVALKPPERNELICSMKLVSLSDRVLVLV